MKQVKNHKSVFVGNWSYSMPEMKVNSIVFYRKMGGQCEVLTELMLYD